MFVRRAMFERLGGFPEQAVLEDVAFCETLNRVTKPIVLDDYVVTDSRKFEVMGIWRSLARVANPGPKIDDEIHPPDSEGSR